MVVNTFT